MQEMLGTLLRFPNAAGSEAAPVSESHGCSSLLRPAFPPEDLAWDGSPHSTAGLELTFSSHEATRSLCEVLVGAPGGKEQ